MRTIGASAGDIDWTVATGGESLLQRVRQRLYFWLGEWFLRTDRGVPYLPEILGSIAPDNLAEQVITAQLRTVPGVTDVTDVVVSFDWENRELTYSAIIHSEYGAFEITESPA